MTDTIVFSGIERSFAGVSVLRGLSLRVRPGEIYALLGRNGAGKTTALSILLGFLEPTGGESSLLGEPSTRLRAETRERIGLVNEGAPMYSWMKVETALDFEAGTRTHFDRKYAIEALARLGIARSKRISQLSRGMRAQLALVFAMGGNPEVLILDDPAMGLDPVMRREFLEAMIDLLGREGRSVLFSSHILPDVERIADRVGILHEGRLIVDVPLDELKRRVQKRLIRGVGEHAIRERALPAVIRLRSIREGVEATLFDLDTAQEHALERLGALSEAVVPTLEELFIDLTRERADAMALQRGGAA
jgi:ABC-2 type transport system ATP-binding protein